MQTHESVRTTSQPLTLSDAMRIRFKWLLEGVAGFLNRLGLMPNTVTLAALLGNFVAAVLLAYGRFLEGGILVLIMGALDSIDGTMARLRGERSDFGAFADSVSDRYSELAIFGGLLFYYVNRADNLMILATFLATAGSVLVPYVRARAESVGFLARGGLMGRFERYLVLAPSLIFGAPWLGIVLIALLANFTALQRIYSVRRQARG
ncbi:MAG: CDP-alcohol phosphatidyltransferase family protein [Anaerolineales bacterium]|nr:CDP-alcohol phosphatidyltransferase family protein [Anaerolineales bacterium]